MNQIPSEILTEIFIQLDQHDKLECMVTCRYWKHVMEQFALYHTLCLYSAASVNSITSIIPNHALKVRRLVLCFSHEHDDNDLDRLLLLLPNLKFIYCSKLNVKSLYSNAKIDYPWAQHIEYIKEFSKNSITSRLLHQPCLNLTTLDIIDFEYHIILIMHNAPALKRLTISYGSYTLQDIEYIHYCCPKLESLTLRGTTNNSQSWSELSSSISLSECVFDDVVVDSFESGISILKYISKRYPMLSKLHCTWISRGGFAITMNDEQAEEGWAPILRNVGPHLEYLCIDSKKFYPDLFGALDRFGCQLKELKIDKLSVIAENIIGSQQLLHLEYICLQTVELELEEGFNWLDGCVKLKKLKLAHPCDASQEPIPIDLGVLLKHAPPKLRSLSFHYVMWAATSFDSMYNNTIESLTMNTCSIDMPDIFIANCFPNLTKLKITGMSLNIGMFDLSCLNLNYLKLVTHSCLHDDTNVLVITKRDGKRRRYARRKTNVQVLEMDWIEDFKLFYPQTISWPERKTDPEPICTLMCNSLNTLILQTNKAH